MRYLGVFFILACIISQGGILAGPFDPPSRDFEFCLSIDGWDEHTWIREPSAMAIDVRSGLIYIGDAKGESLEVFTLQGVSKNDLEDKVEVKAPVGLAIGKDGSVYIAEDGSSAIKALNPEGEVTSIEIPVDEEEKPARPGRMRLDRDGNLYVVDRESNRICVFDKEHKLKLQFGRKGDKRGEFRSLQDVAVDRQGRIYALDSSGVPVQVFDKKGKYIYRFGYRGDGEEDILSPAGLFVDQNDQIWIVDRGQHCLKVFDRMGTFLRKLGRYGMERGLLSQPVSADMDQFGRVYVLEAGARRLQVFSLSRPFEPFEPKGL